MLETPAEFRGVRPDLDGSDDRELHALIERAHQIEMLTQHPGWPMFVDYLTALTGRLQQEILSGYCKTLDEYRAKTGEVKGLRTAIDAPRVLFERVARIQAERDMQAS